MAVGQITAEIQNGALRLSAAGQNKPTYLIGCATSGEFDTMQSITSKAALERTFVSGDLVDLGNLYLAQPGVSEILVSRVNYWYAGSVTKTAAGSTTGTMVNTGSRPLSDYSVRVEFTTAGSLGTAAFKYRLTSSGTYVTGITTASDGVHSIAGTGLILTFANGSGSPGFTVGDVFVFTVSTNATASAVTKTAAASTAGTIATTGSSPYNDYDVQVKITQTGIGGVAAFKYSLDGGDNWSDEYATPISGSSFTVTGTGLVLVFTDGSPAGFTEGDLFAFTTTAPSYPLVSLENALTVFVEGTTPVGFIHVAGAMDSTTAASVVTLLETAETDNHKYVSCLVETVDQASDETEEEWADALLTEWDGLNSRYLVRAASRVEMDLPARKLRVRRPISWEVGPRAASRPFSEDPARVDAGYLGKSRILYLDARKITTLNDSGFLLGRTYDDSKQIYVYRGVTADTQSSDYHLWDRKRVMDAACLVAYTELKNWLFRPVIVNPETGYISEEDALAIENSVQTALKSALVNNATARHASSVAVSLSRTDNVLSTENGTLQIRIVPLGGYSSFDFSIGFVNPANA